MFDEVFSIDNAKPGQQIAVYTLGTIVGKMLAGTSRMNPALLKARGFRVFNSFGFSMELKSRDVNQRLPAVSGAVGRTGRLRKSRKGTQGLFIGEKCRKLYEEQVKRWVNDARVRNWT